MYICAYRYMYDIQCVTYILHVYVCVCMHSRPRVCVRKCVYECTITRV